MSIDVTAMTDEFLLSFRRSADHRVRSLAPHPSSWSEYNAAINLLDRVDIEAERRGFVSVVNDDAEADFMRGGYATCSCGSLRDIALGSGSCPNAACDRV